VRSCALRDNKIKNRANIFLEPITQILGVPEGDVAGEIFINQGSTINITCIVRNLPEKSSMYWTHNNEVSEDQGEKG
jgi:hypothetical protein